METKTKYPKKVEQGKRLATFNKERREERKKMEEGRRQKEEEEFEASLLEYEKWKEMNDEESLTISSPQEKEEKEINSKMNVFIPALALTVVGVGTFWYYRESKREPNHQPQKYQDLKCLRSIKT